WLVRRGLCGSCRSCAGCGGRIADRFLLFSMERYWHTRCLKCSCCHAQLGEIGTTCYSKGGMILCKNDYIRLFGHSGACSACGQSIPASEMVMRAQGNVYHLKCFTCATCRNRLVPGDRFHYVNGTIFCEHDRPGGALLSSHLTSLQGNGMMPDQKVMNVHSDISKSAFLEMVFKVVLDCGLLAVFALAVFYFCIINVYQ
uniref:LIM domain only 4a n=1 Tax=Hucho hucho TaxID=62062 RepID=A0A4W5RLX2_9TELE